MPPPVPNFGGATAKIAGELGTALGSLYDVFRQLFDITKNVIDPLHVMRDAIADVTKTVKDAIKTALEPFKDTLKDMGDAFKIVSGTIAGPVIGAARVFGTALSNVVTAIAGAGQAVMGLGIQLTQFVRLASPAIFQQFNNVLDDFTAVLGQVFAPILEALTPVLRAAADALKTLVPLGQAIGTILKPFGEIFRSLFNIAAAVLQPVVRIFEALAPAIAAVAKLFGELLKAFEPIINVMADFVSALAEAFLKPLVDAINGVMPVLIAFARLLGDILKEWANGFRELMGLGPERAVRPGDSTGAAAKSASVGTVQSVLERTMLSAYSLGSAAASPESRTASAAELIAKKADDIYKAIKDVPAYGEALKKLLGLKTPEISGETSSSVAGFLGLGALGFGISPGMARAGG